MRPCFYSLNQIMLPRLWGTVALCIILAGISLLQPVFASKTPPPASQEILPSANPVNEVTPITYSKYTLPMGSALQVILLTPLNTKINQLGDILEGALASDIFLNGQLILSKNTRFIGKVSQVDIPIQGRNALLGIQFTDIMTDTGDRLPIQAYTKTERPDHAWGGEVTPGSKREIVIHKVWGMGSYGQEVLRGPRVQGNDLEFLPGERLTIVLEEPVSFIRPNPPVEPDELDTP